ncbi:MAG: type I restriction endonuclease subunit R [Cellvibrionales bacterium]|nr:type I restriction endonuclease subunit R [Cellvibrionales bacterium]
MQHSYKTIAESGNFIVLDKYIRPSHIAEGYQSEEDLERELVENLQNQGYEYLKINSQTKMLANVREQLQALNNTQFSDNEWDRFVKEYLDRPNDKSIDKSRKIHTDHCHDFKFDDDKTKNIYLLDKHNLARNKMQVIRQFEQTGTHANRYDVTILVNGLPLVQIELKKRGVAIREAFNQVHRYSKESFNSANSLYKYVQIFIISNGTDSRYFANTTKRDKNSFDFTTNWAEADNSPIKDLQDFTATFLQKNTLLNVLLRYSVLDTSGTLLVMRPYQIAATERMLWKLQISVNAKNWSKPTSGGYIWHTTGSGKTLTSFKAAQLATELEFIDKVLFVVDRKDLDYQTMKEYQRFQEDSVDGSENTAGLKINLCKDGSKIIVTTIQKLNNLLKKEKDLAAYQQQVVFIFDECHRSQFGEVQKNLKKRFKKFYQFGFTGTPIFTENALGAETTKSVFGNELHAYVITDAIRDEKVLKFKVDYNDVRPKFKKIETEQDEEKLTAAENKQALQHLDRIHEISQYILRNFSQKTHRMHAGITRSTGFNAIFAVSSIDAAKLYYESLHQLQADKDKPLRIATIFSFAANEDPAAGDIADEGFEISAMHSTAKEFLSSALADYNRMFQTSFSIDSKGFQNYYRDLAKKVGSREIDLLIVVGMFLTGFDAPTLNTLFVDKNLRNHGLLQAYSRTNRIYDATKTFGNIVTFRDIEQATIDAIQLFGAKNTSANMVLERSYRDYMEGFEDPLTGEFRRGFIAITEELEQRFPNGNCITGESDKREFAKLFGEYLRVENVLRNYDEFTSLKALQHIDTSDPQAIKTFKAQHYLDDTKLTEMQNISMLKDRQFQDYCSIYNDIRDWLRRQRSANEKAESKLDWDDIVFEIELLKQQEIDLDYILQLIFEQHKKNKDKQAICRFIRRLISASLDHRAKEDLLLDFIERTDLNKIEDATAIIENFYTFAREELQRETEMLISNEELKPTEAKNYINLSLNRGFATEYGTELDNTLPAMHRLSQPYLDKKQRVCARINSFVDKFKGIGGKF